MNLSVEQLNKLFELASMDNKIGKADVSEMDITEALVKIERKIQSFSTEIKIESLEDKKILIADDLELSIYQLSTLLKRVGISPIVARNKEEAISEMSKVHFDCVLIDLFIPNYTDGLELISAAVERRKQLHINTKIVVISGTDDTSLIDTCYSKGADFYISKDNEWHTKLLKYLSSSFLSDKGSSFSRFVINSNIACYVVKRLNDSKVIDELLRNISSSVLSGVNNVVFDLKDINAFDSDNAYVFAEIYKICAENNGNFIIISPTKSVKDALSFVYLEDMIKITSTVEEAVSMIVN